jgi:predicted nucleic acid-binding protein
MELYYGALNKRELGQIKKALSGFDVHMINPAISDLAIDLILQYAKSHNLMIPDALIAAAAIHLDRELLTLNMKDFRFIEGLRLVGG